MAEQDGAAAAGGLDQSGQRREALTFAGLAVRFDFADPLAGAGEILGAPEHVRDRRVAVAAGAAGFLIIALDRFRQAGVGDEADVGLVDAHAERDRRAHDHVLRRDERGLVGGADVGLEPGVIRACRTPGRGDLRGQLLGRGAGLGIDDAGAGGGGEEIGELAREIVAGRNQIADVGAVEPGDDQAVVRDAKLIEDVGAGVGVGGGGEREARDVREGVEQRAKQAVVGAEVVAPFRHAVCFVDREQAEPGAGEQIAEAALRGAFGGDVEQVEFAGAEAGDRLGAVLVHRCQRGGADADRFGGAQLVVHQRDQRADHDAGAVEHDRRELIAERLARAGRHDGERPLAGQHARDHLVLHAAQGGEAEHALERWQGLGRQGVGHHGGWHRRRHCGIGCCEGRARWIRCATTGPSRRSS